MITVLHGAGDAEIITISHGGGGGSLGTPKSDYVICARPLMSNHLEQALLQVDNAPALIHL